jgi:CheY-like chemotaxis protein
MSLVGNLEDLSLPDILQIVSLSRKSGILTVEREGRQGKIFIRDGKVIQTVSPRSGKTLGEILSGRGLIRPEDLKKALDIQREGEQKELLGSILIHLGLIDQEVLEKIVQEQIEESIVYFLSWKEGTFSFELSEIKGRGEVSVDPHAFILEKGIDTQWLVLEGTRKMDERSRQEGGAEGEETVAVAEEEAVAEGESETTGSRGGLVLVDDDPVFREQAQERLERLNYRVVACDGTDEALRAVKDFSRSFPPIVVTDIVFPTSDGRGFLGGIELVEKLRSEQPDVPLIAVSAYPDDNVASKVSVLGVKHFLIKPTGGGSEGEGGNRKFYDLLEAALEESRPGAAAPPPRQEAPGKSEREALVEAISEKKAALAEQENSLPAAGLSRSEMTLLQDMMRELQNPRATSEIGLLILRFAAEILNRAALFVIKGGRAVGLGGFGVEVSGQERKGGVRGITIPLSEPSIMEEVVRLKGTCRGPVAQTQWNVRLMEQLGGQTPPEAVAIPLKASGKVRVILYGDNLPDSGALPGTKALEIFLAQAGLTLERVLLEKKLQESAPKAGA